MKHTTGPWHLGQGNGEGSIFTDQETRMRMTERGTTLFPICKIINGWNKEEDGANAHLITAAPELLEACKEVYEFLFDMKTDSDDIWKRELQPYIDKLATVLDKAEGK